MTFSYAIEHNGKIYITFRSLELSGGVNLEALKYHVREKHILPYRVLITEDYAKQGGAYPAGYQNSNDNMHVDVRPYFSREGDTEVIWIYTSYCKSDLQKYGLIPAAEDEDKKGSLNSIREFQEHAVSAAYFIGNWIAKTGIPPSQITRGKIQSILGENDFGHGDTPLFKAVWKSIPHSDKNIEATRFLSGRHSNSD